MDSPPALSSIAVEPAGGGGGSPRPPDGSQGAAGRSIGTARPRPATAAAAVSAAQLHRYDNTAITLRHNGSSYYAANNMSEKY